MSSSESEDTLFGQDDLLLLKRESEIQEKRINTAKMRETHIEYKDQAYTRAIYRFNRYVDLIRVLIGFLKTTKSDEEVCNILYQFTLDDEDIEKKVIEYINRE